MRRESRRASQGFTLIEIMVVIAIIAGLVTTVAVVVPQMQEKQKRLGCMNNLQQLGQIYISEAMDNKGRAQKYSGVALWLSYRKNATLIKRGDEKALTCPGDSISAPETDDDRKKYDDVNLDNPPSDLCSYAARDFKNAPFDVESKDKEAVGSDRQGPNGNTMHHKDVIMVVFLGGDCQPMTRAELNVNTEEAIKIGPEAQSPLLRKMIYRASKVE